MKRSPILHRTFPAAIAHILILFALLIPLVQLPGVPVVQGQIDNNQPTQAFASIVDCIRAGSDRGLPSEASPRFATTCFAGRVSNGGYNGPRDTYDSPAGDPSLITFGDGKVNGVDTFGEPGHVVQASLSQVGTVYGVAYSSGSNPNAPVFARRPRIFTSAFAKRLTRFGPLGPGGIYSNDMGNGTTTGYAQIPAVVPGPNGGTGTPGDGTTTNFPNGTSFAAGSYAPEMGGLHLAGQDIDIAGWIGKTSLGDLDLDPDERYLYTVNLWNKRVYRIDTWSSAPQTTVMALPLPSHLGNAQSCNVSGSGSGPHDLRPFGLHVSRTHLFLGMVCTGEGSQNRSDIAAGVWRYDFATGSWAVSTAFALTAYDAQRPNNTHWRPWRTNFCGYGYPNGPECGAGFQVYAQPLLTDLVLDERGNLILGFRDRFMDLGGNPVLPGTRQILPQGEILRATPIDPLNPIDWNMPQAEVFDDYSSFTGGGDPENTSGALAYLPGRHNGQFGGEIITSWLDPFSTNSFGAAWFDTNGGRPAALEAMYWIFNNPNYAFGKASGIGDIDLTCAWAAFGDRVWRDDNGNGVQDTGEIGLNGVRLQLFAASDTGFTNPLASVTTGDLDGDGQGGEYRFYVNPFVAYQVRLEPGQFNPGGFLADYSVTPINRTSDDRDSDADQISRALTVPALVREQSDTRWDIGLMQNFRANGILGDRVWRDDNNDGIQNEPAGNGINGVVVTAIECLDRTNSCTQPVNRHSFTTTTTAGSPGTFLFTALPPNYYRLRFAQPANHFASPLNRGGNDTLDSDTDTTTGWTTPVIAVYSGTDNRSLDQGFATGITNVSLSITGPATVLVGSQSSYTISYSNGSAVAQAAEINYTIPGGMALVSATGNPIVNGQTLTWSLGDLPTGATGNRTIVLSANTIGVMQHRPNIRTTAIETTTADNTASLDTLVQQANLSIVMTGPATVAPGETFDYAITVRNLQHATMPNGTLAAAANVRLSTTLPAGLIFVSATPNPATTSGESRTWQWSSLAPGASTSVTLHVRATTAQPYPANFTHSAQVSTTTPDRTATDDIATVTTVVRYPNLRITSIAAPAQTAEGSIVNYTINYDNNGLESAQNTVLTVTLPAGTTLRTAGGNPSVNGQTLTWSLGTLANGTSGSLPVEVRVNLNAPPSLVIQAQISTTTPEPNLADNQRQASTNVIAPPSPPAPSGSMQLAIHSDLDPRSNDTDAANGVYRSDGSQINWPAGEVLDFTPRMPLVLPAMSPPQNGYYSYRARIDGWRLVSFTASGAERPASEGDDLPGNPATCRTRELPGSSLADCAYRYIGGSSASDLTEPNEQDMARQAHVFFSPSLPLSMRDDVYVYHTQGLETVQLTVEVRYTVEILNISTGEIVRSTTSSRSQVYTINLVAPRSVK